MSVVRNVINVPACSSHVTLSDFSQSDAYNFDLRSWNYYQAEKWQVLPGVIVGGICLLCLLFFTVWLLSLCCRRRTNWQPDLENAWSSSFRGRSGCSSVVSMCIFVFMLGVVGVSVWGLVTSIKSTDGKIGEAWSISDGAEAKIVDVRNTVQSLNSNLTGLQTSLQLLSSTVQGIDISSISNLTSSQLQQLLSSASTQAASARVQSQQALNQINIHGVQAIQNIEKHYRHVSENSDSIYRYIILACLFGFLIIISVVASLLALYERFPRWTATFTWFLWAFTALIMILGAGGLNGALSTSKDTCLYGETFVLKVAGEHTANNPKVQTALLYYFGKLTVAPKDVPLQIYGIDTATITTVIIDPRTSKILDYLSSPAGSAVIDQLPLNATAKAALKTAPVLVAGVSSSVSTLTDRILSANFADLYARSKRLICCDVTGILHNLWIAWTIAGALAGTLAVLLTYKVLASVVRDPQVQFITEDGVHCNTTYHNFHADTRNASHQKLSAEMVKVKYGKGKGKA